MVTKANQTGLLNRYRLKTDDYVIVLGDSGTTFGMGTAAKLFTLPAASDATKGMEVSFINTGAAANNIITIASAVADFIAGTITLAATVVVKGGTVDKDLINTAASSQLGDSCTLVCDGVDGWFIKCSTGIWASE